MDCFFQVQIVIEIQFTTQALAALKLTATNKLIFETNLIFRLSNQTKTEG